MAAYVREKPTRRTLLELKERRELAEKAHRLLEQKHMLLREELASIEGRLSPLKDKFRSDLAKAYSYLDEACETDGTGNVVLAAYSRIPDSEVELRRKTSRGLFVPEIVSTPVKKGVMDSGYSLYSTSPVLDLAAGLFQDVLSTLIVITELESAQAIYETETRKTRVKVEALERILLPKIKEAIGRIESGLEESERQEHFMVRRVRDIKTTRALGHDD